MNELWFIPPFEFLSELSGPDSDRLLALARTRHYRRHEYVFRCGGPGNNVYMLRKGRVKICQISPVGREMIQWFCFPGEVFGLAEVPRGGPREVFAEACTDTEVLSVSREDFRGFLATSPAAAMLVIDLLACRLRALGDMLNNLTSDDVSSRVIKLLTRLSARYGRRTADTGILLDIHLTHQEMADMIGTCRQTVTSELGKLRQQGVLRMENHCIHIQRPDLLETLGESQERRHQAAAVS